MISNNVALYIREEVNNIFRDKEWEELMEKYSYINTIEMDPKELIFEKRVLMNCFYCGRYNHNWKCPPNIPKLDYKEMFGEYQKGLFVYVTIPFDEMNYGEVRSNSSVVLHKALLDMEKYLWNHNDSTAVSFIGGSCKLCRNGCGKEGCNNPYESRTPLEATGVNVNKSAEKYGITITYPPKDKMVRVGLIVFD